MAVTVLRAFDHGNGVIAVVYSDDDYPEIPELQISGFLPFRDPYQSAYDDWLGAGNTPQPPAE